MRTKKPKETMAGLRRQLDASRRAAAMANDANEARVSYCRERMNEAREGFEKQVTALTEKHKADLSALQSRVWAAESAVRNDREFFERVISALAHVPPKPPEAST